MNEVNILLADNENFKFATVVFAPYTGTKTYTYKTMLDIQVDDFVVVDTPSNGFQVCQVREVLTPMEVDLEVKFSYKWIVQKVDTEQYDKSVALEKSVRAFVNQSKNKRAIAEAKERILGSIDNPEEVTKLIRL